MELQCMIIEDEPLAAEVLTDYIRQVQFLSLAASCTDAVQAVSILKNKSVDVIFLDLHLPGLKGFEMLKTLTQRPQVIITTAYHQYALEGYEWQVVDYLVKPIEFSRFLAAVNKLSVAKVDSIQSLRNSDSLARPCLFVYADKKQVRIFLDEILFVESERDYLKIMTKEKIFIIRQTLQEFKKQLPGETFIRTHRSFIVNTKAIEAFDAAHVEVAGRSIPVGRLFRMEVKKNLQQRN